MNSIQVSPHVLNLPASSTIAVSAKAKELRAQGSTSSALNRERFRHPTAHHRFACLRRERRAPATRPLPDHLNAGGDRSKAAGRQRPARRGEGRRRHRRRQAGDLPHDAVPDRAGAWRRGAVVRSGPVSVPAIIGVCGGIPCWVSGTIDTDWKITRSSSTPRSRREPSRS